MSTTDLEDVTLDAPLSGVPERLGPCRLVRRLGRGGAGTVYLAEMAEERPYASLATPVAIKVLHPALLHDPGALRRFLLEGNLGSALDHPAVVRTYEVNAETAGDATIPYLVMEYVEGRVLRMLMEELRALPEAMLRDLGAQIARGLEVIHEAGAVHRDLKPANVLITPCHQVKLMDLGVARLVEEAAGPTLPGDFVGSPHYAAPEQFDGEGVGPASDLYALGVMLYEGAVGSHPFASGSLHSVMRSHLERVPPKVGQVNSRITPFLEEVIACLMEKEPGRRFSSAGELASVLEEGAKAPWWRERERTLRTMARGEGLRRVRVPRDVSLVGRKAELDLLRSLYEEARQGRGRVLLMEGAAGIGKSRLIDEFLALLEREATGARILYGSHTPGPLAVGAGALAEAVVGHLGGADLENHLARFLTDTPRMAPAFAAMLTDTPPPSGSMPLSEAAAQSLFCQLARGLAGERTVVWVVEDLQFASAHSRSLLLSLARIAAGQNLLLIATTRPEIPEEESVDLKRLGVARHRRLGPLSREEVGRLLREALRCDDVTDELADTVATKSEGSPFFILEMIRELKQRGVLEKMSDGSYAGAGKITGVEVPSMVRGLLLSRLKTLDEDTRTLLEVGAVQGFTFDPGLVAQVKERRDLDVLETLARIERSTGLIQSTGTGFRFDHHLLQEVTHDAVPVPLREAYHCRLAEAYEARAGLVGKAPDELPGEAAVFLAGHFFRGGEVDKGLAALLPALRHLAFRHENERVIELSDLGIEKIGEEAPAVRCQVRLGQVRCLHMVGRTAEARAAAEDALALARKLGDPARSRRARCELAWLLSSTGDSGAPRELLAEVLEESRDAGDLRGEASACTYLGRIATRVGEFEQACEYHEREIALARELDNRWAEGLAMRYLATAHQHLGRHRDSLDGYQKSLAILREVGDQRGVAGTIGSIARVLTALGRLDEAREQFEVVVEAFRELGDRAGECTALGALGVVQRDRGHYAEARAALEEGMNLGREAGFRPAQAAALDSLGFLALDEGKLEEAAGRFAESGDFYRTMRMRLSEAWPLHGLGDLARVRQEGDQARSLYEEALAIRREAGEQDTMASTALALGRHLLEQGRAEEARPLLEEADALTRELERADPGPLPGAYLALLGHRDPERVEVREGGAIRVRAEAHLVLHRAGARGDHLMRARALVEQMSSHLSGPDLEAFWQGNPIARAVREELDS